MQPVQGRWRLAGRCLVTTNEAASGLQCGVGVVGDRF